MMNVNNSLESTQRAFLQRLKQKWDIQNNIRIYIIPYGFENQAEIMHKEDSEIARKVKEPVFICTTEWAIKPSLDVNSTWFPVLRDRRWSHVKQTLLYQETNGYQLSALVVSALALHSKVPESISTVATNTKNNKISQQTSKGQAA
jgi:hypothetical protein